MSPAEPHAEPLFGVAITVLAYGAAKALHRRWSWAHPLFFTCLAVVVVLKLTKVSFSDYRVGGSAVQFFLSPATIALGVPLYKQWGKVRKHAGAVVAAIVAGAASGMAAAGELVRLLGGSRVVLLSMVPKSVTTPISMEVARQLGGTPELAAAFTVTAGLVGSVIGPALLRRAGVRGDLAIGAAMGTAAHGIGTARVIQESELQGGVSGLAMALAGIVTSLLAIPVHWWLG
jgi:predicted murein hydrolase (TIGR00659 family)